MARNEQSIAGKPLIVYNSRGNKKYCSSDIGNFLKRFQLNEALRLIGSVSHGFLNAGISRPELLGVPVPDSVLAYIAMRLIESSNDYRSGVMTVENLRTAADMYFGLPDPIEEDREVKSCLTRFGLAQFDYQSEMRNLLPRTLLIYRKLWNSSRNRIDVKKAIQEISGLDLDELLMLGFAFSGNPREKGFLTLYEDLTMLSSSAQEFFRIEKQRSFVDWVSCDYSTFRREAKAESDRAPSPLYEKYRLNPLLTNPIIKPDRNPLTGRSAVYLVPISRLLYQRITRGLYFDLSEVFKTDSGNEFRTCFGHVFQDYVGELLKEVIGRNHVSAEEIYDDKLNKRTPDWVVLQDGKAILVEVKQSGLYRQAKTWGEIDRIKSDLRKTIVVAVKQLWNFEKDLETGKYGKLEWLAQTKDTERLVVTYDRTYFPNSLSLLGAEIRQELKKDGFNIPEEFHWHVISVAEIEDFLGIHGQSLFAALKSKRLDPAGDAMDFGDYLAREQPRSLSNPYLDKITNDFFEELRVERLPELQMPNLQPGLR